MTAPTPTPAPASASVRGGAWALAAVAVFAVARAEPGHLTAAAAAVVGAAAAAVVARHPLRATLALVVALPFDLYAAAALYRVGVPAQAMRPLRFWPEVILAGLAVAALRNWLRGPRRLDGPDRLALAFVALATVYLLVPGPFVHAPLGAHLGLYARALGWRTDVMYVAVFLVARRLPMDLAGRERVLRWVIAVGTVVAALGLVEFAAPGAWDGLAAATLQVPRYQRDVLAALPIGSSLTTVEVRGSVAGAHLVRVGSVLDYESLGFYLAICLGAGTELWARGRPYRWLPPALVVVALGLVVTQTRSGILAGAVAAGLALRRRPRLGAPAVRRLAAVGAALLVTAGALYVFAGVGARLTGDTKSNAAHAVELRQGVRALFAYPLGRGLATAGPQYKRAALQSAGLSTQYTGPATGIAVTDDQWLAVGTELGLAGLAVYLAMIVMMIARLGRRPGPGGPLAWGTRNALAGIAVGAAFLQPFTGQAVSITLFTLVGLGLAATPAAEAAGRVVSASVAAR